MEIDNPQEAGRLVYFGITTEYGKQYYDNIPLPEVHDQAPDIQRLDTPFILYAKVEQQGDLIVNPGPPIETFIANPWQVLKDGVKHTKIVGFQGEYGKLPFQPYTSSAKRLAQLTGVTGIHEVAETANLLAVPPIVDEYSLINISEFEKLEHLSMTLWTLMGESRCCQFILCGQWAKKALEHAMGRGLILGCVDPFRVSGKPKNFAPFKMYFTYHPVTGREQAVSWIPHPSGLCREWDDPATLKLGCDFMRWALDPQHHSLEANGDGHTNN